MRSIPVVIVGGGQAGLSVAWHLTQNGIEHLVVERDRVLHEWQDSRWDSFCLVTPNWQCQLPGYPYNGSDPDGFMVKDELNAWLAGYLETFAPTISEQTTVESVIADETSGGFLVRIRPTGSEAETLHADQVVVATGGYHHPAVPRMAERLPSHIAQLHSATYKNPSQLPDGSVLVVGTGQSGAQIAEDLHLAGRTVHLAVGNAPRSARVYRGRDVIAWLNDMGHYDKPVTDQPIEERHRDRTNHYLTGRDGGRDIDLRLFASQGVTLHGHLGGIDDDGTLTFADDLGRNLDSADDVYNGINRFIDAWITEQGIDAPPPTTYEAAWQPVDGPTQLKAEGISAVVWATGFTSDYRWLHAGVFDGSGIPQHLRGVTAVAGLYFIGLPLLNTWGSGRFAAVARDADHLCAAISARHRATREPAAPATATPAPATPATPIAVTVGAAG